LLKPGDCAQSRGLSAARWAEQRQLFTGQDIETDTAHRRDAAIMQLKAVDLDMWGQG
jgi:hypothetical protein